MSDEIEIQFVDASGEVRKAWGRAGFSVMEVAANEGIPGIDADCGGALACATCHVYVQEDWLAKLEPMKGGEKEMLEFARDVRPESRLSCQIKLSPELDGLTVTTPSEQGMD